MSSEAQELKPCPNPHCNYKSGLEVVEELYGPYSKVFCPSFRLCGPRMANAAGAAEMWNLLPRRALTPSVTRLVEAAKEFDAVIQKPNPRFEYRICRDPDCMSDICRAYEKLRAALAKCEAEKEAGL